MIAKVPFPDSIQTLEDLLRGLGGIPSRRVRLRPLPGTATMSDVIQNKRCELIDGVLVEKPMGWIDSALAIRLGRYLDEYLSTHDLGMLSGETGSYRFSPRLVRAPDLSFVAWDRLPEAEAPKDAVPALVPNLAIEILSKGNTRAEMIRKRREYFEAGVEEVWMIDPAKRTAQVFVSEKESRTLGKNDTLTDSKVLPGLTLSLKNLFANIDRRKGRKE